jgi:hypothetical protein
LRRGSKTQAEKSAAEARKALGMTRIGKLDPCAYAAHLNVIILDFDKLGLSEGAVRQLTVADEPQLVGHDARGGRLAVDRAKSRACAGRGRPTI